MKTLTLRRFERAGTYTLGNLANEHGDFDLFTLERAWLDNKKAVSCIREGLYVCEHFDGQKYKDVWQVKNVKDRSAILIHPANYAHQLKGCIAVGMKNAPLGNEKILVDSRLALQKLKDYIGRDEKGKLNKFFLNIVNI